MGTVLIDWSTIDWKKVTKRTVPIGSLCLSFVL
jgi:hypothetical protein